MGYDIALRPSVEGNGGIVWLDLWLYAVQKACSLADGPLAENGDLRVQPALANVCADREASVADSPETGEAVPPEGRGQGDGLTAVCFLKQVARSRLAQSSLPPFNRGLDQVKGPPASSMAGRLADRSRATSAGS